MFVSTMEGPTLKDRPGMLVVIRNVSVMMEEQVITPATKGISYFIKKSSFSSLSFSHSFSLINIYIGYGGMEFLFGVRWV